MENHHRNSEISHEHGGSFNSYVKVYQRVNQLSNPSNMFFLQARWLKPLTKHVFPLNFVGIVTAGNRWFCDSGFALAMHSWDRQKATAILL